MAKPRHGGRGPAGEEGRDHGGRDRLRIGRDALLAEAVIAREEEQGRLPGGGAGAAADRSESDGEILDPPERARRLRLGRDGLPQPRLQFRVGGGNRDGRAPGGGIHGA